MDDARGVPVSCDDADALAQFEQALRAFQSYGADPTELIAPALDRRPDFIIGHVLNAVVLYLTSERRFVGPATASLHAAQQHLARATNRERVLLRAVQSLTEGDWEAASAAFDSVLVDHPRDALALQAGHLTDFFRGDVINLRNRVTRVLPNWTPDTPGYGFVLGMHAFGLEECNEYDAAEAAALAAIECCADDVWAIHAATHIYEMRGQIEHGVQFLESSTERWAGDNGLAHHNWWHLGLLYLDLDQADRTLEILDSAVIPGAAGLSIGVLDSTSMLWRLQLLGYDVGDRLEHDADLWQARQDIEPGHYAFNDFHAALAYAATGRRHALAEIARAMADAAENGEPGNRMMASAVGVRLIDALTDFAEARYADAAAKLVTLRDRCQAFGGSHAQRDVITLTLIAAARRAGNDRLADHYLSERTMIKPHSHIARRLGAES